MIQQEQSHHVEFLYYTAMVQYYHSITIHQNNEMVAKYAASDECNWPRVSNEVFEPKEVLEVQDFSYIKGKFKLKTTRKGQFHHHCELVLVH